MPSWSLAKSTKLFMIFAVLSDSSSLIIYDVKIDGFFSKKIKKPSEATVKYSLGIVLVASLILKAVASYSL